MKVRFWFRLGLAAIGLLFGGCGLLWPGEGLRADMEAVLRSNGAPLPALTCQMGGRGRDGHCTLSLTAAEQTQLVSALHLAPVDASRLPDNSESCALLPEFAQSAAGLTIYEIGGRDPLLRTAAGSQFEYLRLFLRADAPFACIEVSYAYG